jgi:hypothetical protein
VKLRRDGSWTRVGKLYSTSRRLKERLWPCQSEGQPDGRSRAVAKNVVLPTHVPSCVAWVSAASTCALHFKEFPPFHPLRTCPTVLCGDQWNTFDSTIPGSLTSCTAVLQYLCCGIPSCSSGLLGFSLLFFIPADVLRRRRYF